LKDVGEEILTTCPFNFPIWPIEKRDGSWVMTMDYHKLNQVLTSAVAAIPDEVSLLEQLAHPLEPGVKLFVYKKYFF
jgi:hypothetical protein